MSNQDLSPFLNPKVSVAPMMDWTDKHCRYFHRLLTRHTLLFTEMITAKAVIHGDQQKLLSYHPTEHPIALQLGGSDPRELAQATHIASAYHYDEINLNVGCPSDRVQAGCFGLALLKQPQKVQDCFSAMQEVTDTPITIKTRTGVDDIDDYDYLARFVEKLSRAGCQRIYLHARKGWLKGLSPKENRDIPPLEYEKVYQIKQDFPHLHIGINGGIHTLDETQEHLKHVDSVMLGRSAYHDPYLLTAIDQAIYHDSTSTLSREEVIQKLLPYAHTHCAQGGRITTITRHILGLFQKQPGAKKWRRYLSEHAHQPDADERILLEALEAIRA